MKKILKIKSFFLFFIIFIFTNVLNAQDKIIIELQIGEEIITNFDFIKEQNYLIALNNSLKNVPKNQLKKIARDSLIREKIKKNELKKVFDLNKSNKHSEQFLYDFYKRLNFKNENELNDYLKNFNINSSDIKEKLKIEYLWNELVYKKFINRVKIDEKKIKDKIKSQKNKLIEYDLSEILFEIDPNETLDNKYNKILKSIKDTGFENSANIFSVSESSKFGGKVGWINEKQPDELLLKEIESLKLNEISKPIQANNGYLIIKVSRKREKDEEIDFDKSFNLLLNKEKNRQLNQYSLIYFNKIKQNIFISEK